MMTFALLVVMVLPMNEARQMIGERLKMVAAHCLYVEHEVGGSVQTLWSGF